MTKPRCFPVTVLIALLSTTDARAATEIRVDSEDGEFIGKGQSVILTPENGSLQATNEGEYFVEISWRKGVENTFTFQFISPDYETALVPGLYEGARETGTDNPIMYVSGNFSTCKSNGQYEIHEIEFVDGAIHRFAVDLVQTCLNNPRLLKAQIRINSDVSFDLGPRVRTVDDFVVLPGQEVEASLAFAETTNGEIEAYAWTQIYGEPVALAGADTDTINFIAPVPSAEYEALKFELVATDSAGETATDTLTVVTSDTSDIQSVFSLTTTPDGYIGGSQSIESQYIDEQFLSVDRVRAGVRVAYSPPDERGWEFEIAPAWEGDLDLGQFDTAYRVPFRPYDKPGVDFGLTGRGCNESFGEFKILDIGFAENVAVERLAVDATVACVNNGDPDPVEFRLRYRSVVPLTSRAPIADAGPDLVVHSGDTVALDAFATQNDHGAITSIEWTQLVGPGITLEGANQQVATFLAPEVAAGTGRTEFLLTVVNDQGFRDSEPVSVQILGSDDAKSYVTLRVDPGTGLDWVTNSYGVDLRLDPNYGYMFAPPYRRKVALEYVDFGVYAFEFAADGDFLNRDSNLVPGIYRNAGNARSGLPHLNVSGPGRGCNTTIGFFEVHEYEEDEEGWPAVVAIDFEQKCESVGAPLHGVLRFNSKVPAPPPAEEPTPPPASPPPQPAPPGSPPPSPPGDSPSASGGGGSSDLVLCLGILILIAARRRQTRKSIARNRIAWHKQMRR